MKRYAFSTCLILNLAACSSWTDNSFITARDREHLYSSSSAPLQVPPHMQGAPISNDYPVPSGNVQTTNQRVNLLPPDSLAEQLQQGKISKAQFKQMEKEGDAAAEQAQLAAKNKQNMQSNANPQTNAAGDATTQTTNGPSVSFVDNASLTLNQDFEQAWTNVANAAPKAGYKILVQNKNRRTMYLLDMPSTGDTATKATPIYEAHFRGTRQATQIYLTKSNNQPIAKADADRVLNNLNNALTGKPTAIEIPGQTTNFGRFMDSLFSK